MGMILSLPISRIKLVREMAVCFEARRGGAVVELAITLPLLVIVSIGVIDICEQIFLKQSATVVAYEGARLAARRTATTAQVRRRCEQLMNERRISDGTIQITPAQVQNAATAAEVTVVVEARRQGFFIRDSGAVTATATVLKE
jgi:Flp pilus assembly protein TadG